MAASRALTLPLQNPFLGKMGVKGPDRGRFPGEPFRLPPAVAVPATVARVPVHAQALFRKGNNLEVGPSHSEHSNLSPKLPSLSGSPEGSSQSGPVTLSATAAPVLERPAVEQPTTIPPSISFFDENTPFRRPVPTLHDFINRFDNLLVDDQNLPSDHPGFSDEKYVRRRRELAAIARNHKFGRAIPRIDYSPEEIYVWGTSLNKLRELHPTHACSKYNAAVQKLDFRPDEIPQLEDVSSVMYQQTGWRIRPVAGLMDPRDFIGAMAFKIFHCTQYVRHHSQPMYSPEPDLCHELIGHVPMLLDPEFSDMVQAIGKASLGATDAEFLQLTRLFWYTCEFGVIEEDGQMKAFGAGLLSSFGELAYMRDGHEGVMPRFRALGDPRIQLPPMRHKPGFQTRYMVSNGFADVARKLSTFAAHIDRK